MKNYINKLLLFFAFFLLTATYVIAQENNADKDKEFTKHQMSLFEQGVTKIKEYYPNIKYIHAEASNGILNVNSKFCNLVRPGILLYGYAPTDTIQTKIDLKHRLANSNKVILSILNIIVF